MKSGYLLVFILCAVISHGSMQAMLQRSMRHMPVRRIVQMPIRSFNAQRAMNEEGLSSGMFAGAGGATLGYVGGTGIVTLLPFMINLDDKERATHVGGLISGAVCGLSGVVSLGPVRCVLGVVAVGAVLTERHLLAKKKFLLRKVLSRHLPEERQDLLDFL